MQLTYEQGRPDFRDPSESILEILENGLDKRGPPKATLAKRAKSYSDFYEVCNSYFGKSPPTDVPIDVLEPSKALESGISLESNYDQYENDFLDASQEDYQYVKEASYLGAKLANSRFRLYRDQLDLSERHLGGLLDGTTQALSLLAKLSESFKTVESQTTAFQAQCEDLLVEQKRIRGLADEVGADLQYYAYLDPLTRRMNTATGSRLVKSDDFLDVLVNLNTCIDFMDEHVCPLLLYSTILVLPVLKYLEAWKPFAIFMT